MKRYFKLIIVPAALLALAACVKEETGENTLPESANVVSFVLGGDNVVTKSADGAPAASYAIEGVEKAEGLALVETVSSLDEMFSPAEVGTKGAPVYNENFDDLYSSQLYATAYEPKTGSAQLTDPWGSGLGSHGTVKLENTGDLKYKFDYGSLAWPAEEKLMYFLQASDATKSLSPAFYANGSIQFDYTDPGYVGGLNGWWVKQSGIERYPGCSPRALSGFIAESGKEYHIQTGIIKDTCFMVVDDKLVLTFTDDNPINDPECNRVGLGIYCSKIAFRKFRLYRAIVHPAARE